MYQPSTTYRIQFHRDFAFKHLEEIIPYLYKLGIKTIYASPIFSAMSGSQHGYDGLNPNEINPELGTLGELVHIRAKLKTLGMGWLQDFVPNHMAFSTQNIWVASFLEQGSMSKFDFFFDKHPDEPIMLPFLGSSLKEVIIKQEIELVFVSGKLQCKYADILIPLNYKGYQEILKQRQFENLGFNNILILLEHVSSASDSDAFQRLWSQLLHSIKEFSLDQCKLELWQQGLKEVSKNEDFLKAILDLQFYRLCHWSETNHTINYRRFFTVNGLIGVNIEQPEVFGHYHQLLKKLIDDDIIQGVRIDHIDGLYNPGLYLEQLRALVGDDVYIVVEKILAEDEKLPSEWPIQGSSGYDFLSLVNKLMVNTASEVAFDIFYQELKGKEREIHHLAIYLKYKILQEYMYGELENLVSLFKAIPNTQIPHLITDEMLKDAIAAFLVYTPVYRYYFANNALSQKDVDVIKKVFTTIALQKSSGKDALQFLQKTLTHTDGRTQDSAKATLHFLNKCMQTTGPIMAKGVEDTLMYQDFRLLASNEVGDSLATFGMEIDVFHQKMIERQLHEKLTMNATATHDTKRGEDTRARLQCMTGLADEWLSNVHSWLQLASSAKGMLTSEDQYFVIQSIFGTINFANYDELDFKNRIEQYFVKAAREAKQHSSWDKPDEEYEADLVRYALHLADLKTSVGLAIRKFIKEKERAIVVNSLVQLTLKCCCPGIPDIYQGTEYWDLSFVDPDNRRKVDYKERELNLDKILSGTLKPDILWRQCTNGNLKLFVLQKLLTLRSENIDLLCKGLYIPIKVATIHSAIAFARRCGSKWALVVLSFGEINLSAHQDFTLELPADAPQQWKHIFTGEQLNSQELHSSAIFQRFPLAVFESVPETNKRRAGILLPIFSLPNNFGIGDMGASAYHFAQYLASAGQKIWQILPLSPVMKGTNYSPYSAKSAFAGEPAYIDLQQLVNSGLLAKNDLVEWHFSVEDTVEYEQAFQFKYALLEKAWRNYQVGNYPKWNHEYGVFCKNEKEWLDDYALYVVLEKTYNNMPWSIWPVEHKHRSPKALNSFAYTHGEEIAKQKWFQFIFFKQWNELKYYCEQLGIELWGDLPFYMDTNSADVWRNQSLFMLDNAGEKTHVAGVPPDYFSETGQLWGMPTYNWEQLKWDGYNWWLLRLQKNIEMYHKARLDHFRAFYDYWEIPANAITAMEGKWVQGPQHSFFDLLQKRFPTMPFIAEDLGEIHNGVFDFRNKYDLPGMRILQFGFDNYDVSLRDLPHNYHANTVAYTGTHDNNTTKAWYEGLSEDARQNLATYLQHEVVSTNVTKSMIDLAYKSVANTVIVPLQDILNLDESARINTPSTTEGNWQWRFKCKDLTEALSSEMRERTKFYNRT